MRGIEAQVNDLTKIISQMLAVEAEDDNAYIRNIMSYEERLSLRIFSFEITKPKTLSESNYRLFSLLENVEETLQETLEKISPLQNVKSKALSESPYTKLTVTREQYNQILLAQDKVEEMQHENKEAALVLLNSLIKCYETLLAAKEKAKFDIRLERRFATVLAGIKAAQDILIPRNSFLEGKVKNTEGEINSAEEFRTLPKRVAVKEILTELQTAETQIKLLREREIGLNFPLSSAEGFKEKNKEIEEEIHKTGINVLRKIAFYKDDPEVMGKYQRFPQQLNAILNCIAKFFGIHSKTEQAILAAEKVIIDPPRPR